jgi:hypothetical protein
MWERIKKNLTAKNRPSCCCYVSGRACVKASKSYDCSSWSTSDCWDSLRPALLAESPSLLRVLWLMWCYDSRTVGESGNIVNCTTILWWTQSQNVRNHPLLCYDTDIWSMTQKFENPFQDRMFAFNSRLFAEPPSRMWNEQQRKEKHEKDRLYIVWRLYYCMYTRIVIVFRGQCTVPVVPRQSPSKIYSTSG